MQRKRLRPLINLPIENQRSYCTSYVHNSFLTGRHMTHWIIFRRHKRRDASLLFVAISSFLIAPMAVADDTGMASIHSWRAERGKVCLIDHYHAGNGEGRTKKLARRAAIKDWQGFTAWEYGTDWAYFKRAASRAIEYSRTESGWQARLEARPCRKRKRRGRRSRRK